MPNERTESVYGERHVVRDVITDDGVAVTAYLEDHPPLNEAADGDAVSKPPKPDIEHVGGKCSQQRLKYRPRGHPEGPDLESLFSEHWIKNNTPVPYLNGGQGTLEILMSQNEMGTMTQRDARIAAMVVQWMGTNCGFAFVHEVIREYGYELDYSKRWKKQEMEVIRLARVARERAERNAPTRPVPEEEEI